MEKRSDLTNWVLAFIIAMLLTVVAALIRIPAYLCGWWSCIVFYYSYSRLTNTKMKFVPKDKVTEDMN